MNSKVKKYLKFFGTALGIIIILLLATYFIIRQIALSRLTPDERRQYKEWFTKKWYFEPEDLAAAPFSKDTIEAAKKLRTQYEIHKDKALRLVVHHRKFISSDGKSTDTVNMNNLIPDMVELEPMFSAFEGLVKKPDYDLTALRAGMEYHGMQTMSVSFINSLEYIKTCVLLYQGKIDEALQNAEITVCASRVPRYSSIISLFEGISSMQRGIKAWYAAVKQCNNAVLLRHSLERMRKVAPRKDLIVKDVPLMLLELIGAIRDAKKGGLAVRDIQGKTANEIALEAMRIYDEYMEKICLPSIREPAEKARREKILKEEIDFSAVFGYKVKSLRGLFYKIASPFYNSWMLTQYRSSLPLNPFNVHIRVQCALAYYDLLMLETERKIRKLEGGGAEVSIIEKSLKDVFSKDGQAYGEKPVFYSVGPDCIDQHASILYDPTNGTISPGDVFFK